MQNIKAMRCRKLNLRFTTAFICLTLASSSMFQALAGPRHDYAKSDLVDAWTHHPVYGDPSFDAFSHSTANPIHRGAAPYEWPVNSFFYSDPVSGNWYVYVGDYCDGYVPRPSRCLLYRSRDRGVHWENLDIVLQGDKASFDLGGHTPDVSIVYADGRYHMIYDWVEPDWNQLGGLGYAWAEKPEGPFHRAPIPITRNKDLPELAGRYRRTYAATLIQRKHDWMILAMMDHAPNSWALFAMTAPRPEGPYGERVLLRHVEADEFLPPLLEFYPAFIHKNYLYAPATAVALNRNYNALFGVPIEHATNPAAWRLIQNGSLWHSENVEHETFGLWGQTFAGFVDKDGAFRVTFHSRDAHGMGTVNLATRSWKQPMRDSGFTLSGHAGASITLLRHAFDDFQLTATLRVHGIVRLLLNYQGALGPNVPESNATLHSKVLTDCNALELAGNAWKIIRFDTAGTVFTLATGTVTDTASWQLKLQQDRSGWTTLAANDREVWQGQLPKIEAAPCVLGLQTEAHSHLIADKFVISGRPQTARINYLSTEALLGAGESRDNWEEKTNSGFRFGFGMQSRQPNARAKWNFVGKRCILWSRRGPDSGPIEIRLDGKLIHAIDLRCASSTAASAIWTSPLLRNGEHALVVSSHGSPLQLDSLEVEN